MQFVPNIILKCSWLMLTILLLFSFSSSIIIYNFYSSEELFPTLCFVIALICIYFLIWYIVFGNTIYYYKCKPFMLFHLFMIIYFIISCLWIVNQTELKMYFTVVTTMLLGIVSILLSIDWSSKIDLISIQKPHYLKSV
jgi:hypothetical protein